MSPIDISSRSSFHLMVFAFAVVACPQVHMGLQGAEESYLLRAGAHAADITPEYFPVSSTPHRDHQIFEVHDLLADQTPLEARREDEGVIVTLPALPPDPINSVVVLKVGGALDIESLVPTPSDDGPLVLTADAAYIHNNEGSRQARVQQREDSPNNIGYWTDANAWVEWSFKVDQPGKYEILAELAVEQERSRFRIELARQQKSVEALSTGSYYRYVKKSLATIRIDQAGKYTLSIKPEKDDWQPINLRQLELRRR